MTVRALYNEARRALAVVTEDPAFEALCLVEKYFGLDRSGLLLHGDRAADAETEKAFQIAVEQRLSGEPLQYLLGEWDFMALTLFCGPGVLIPRDDTAVLVEAAAERLRGAKQPRGPGCLTISPMSANRRGRPFCGRPGNPASSSIPTPSS